MGYMRDVSGKRLDSFEVRGTANMQALRPAHRALMSRRSTPMDCLLVGHSFLHGASGTGTIDIYDRFADSMLRAMRVLAPTSGVVGGRGSFAANTSVNSGYPVVNTAAFTSNANFGIGRRSWQMSGATTLVYTAPAGGATSVDIIWTRNTGLGSFSWKVNSGSAATVVQTGALLPAQVTHVAGPLNAGDTITVAVVSGTIVVENFFEYNGDEAAGIRLWNGGKGSQQTLDFINAPNWYSSITMNPDLVVIACMVNNYGGSSYTPISSADTKTQLKSIIASIRAKCATPPSIVLCIEYPRQDSGSSNHIEPWDNYVDIAYEIAAEDTAGHSGESLIAIFDMRERLGYLPDTDDLLVGTDLVHPTAAGHQLWADAFARFLMPA